MQAATQHRIIVQPSQAANNNDDYGSSNLMQGGQGQQMVKHQNQKHGRGKSIQSTSLNSTPMNQTMTSAIKIADLSIRGANQKLI